MEYDEPKLNRQDKKKLALAEMVLIVLGIIGLAVIVWFGWFKPSSRTGTSKTPVDSFVGCVAAGNPIQETYPETCVTPEGRRFTNPE